MINIVAEGKKIRCSSCRKNFLVLKLIQETNEKLCERCFNEKGGMDYVLALRELDLSTG